LITRLRGEIRISKWLRPAALCATLALMVVLGVPQAHAQMYTATNTNGGAWNTTRWGTNSAGPSYLSAWVTNTNAIFLSNGTYTFAGGGTTDIGNVTVQSNTTVTFTAVSGTFGTGGNVRTIDVATNSVLDFSSQSISIAAGTGFIKTGAGVFRMAGSTNQGGFTLNEGTMVVGGVNAMGGGPSNVLTLSNGILAANASRSITNKRSEERV
jgi:hypothetical protein